MKKYLLSLVLVLLTLVGCSSKINALYIRCSWVEGIKEYTYLFETRKQLDDFYNEFSNPYYLNDAYLDKLSTYNDDYFVDNNLALVIISEGSGSIRHEVKSYNMVDGYLNIDIKTKAPSVGTDDMALWHIFVEVEKTETKDCLGVKIIK